MKLSALHDALDCAFARDVALVQVELVRNGYFAITIGGADVDDPEIKAAVRSALGPVLSRKLDRIDAALGEAGIEIDDRLAQLAPAACKSH